MVEVARVSAALCGCEMGGPVAATRPARREFISHGLYLIRDTKKLTEDARVAGNSLHQALALGCIDTALCPGLSAASAWVSICTCQAAF